MMSMMLICLPIIGCVGLKNFLCSPTPEQIRAAQVGKAIAQTILSTVGSITGNPLVTLLAGQAIPVFDEIIKGVCTTQEQWNIAVSALEQALATTKVKSSAIAELRAVRW